MAEQRQPFRFRLPWLTASSTPAPRPAAPQQPRPAAETRAPPQPTTAVPVQRPPFRPAGRGTESRVPSQPTSPTRGGRASSVPPSPSRGRGTTESRIGSQPSTPPRATQTQIPSATITPPHAQTDARSASVPRQPIRGRDSSQPGTPPRATTQTTVPSETRSPPRAQTETRSTSVPLSTRGRGPESRVSSQPSTPPRAATRTQIPLESRSPPGGPTQTRQPSVPPSPSRAASQTQAAPRPTASQPAVQISSEPRSPTRQPTQVQPPPRSQPAAQISTQPISPQRQSTQVQPPASQPGVQISTQPISPQRQPTQIQPPPPPSQAIQTSALPVSQLHQPSQVQRPPKALSPPPSSPIPVRDTSHPTRELIPSPSQEPQPKTQIKSEILCESDYESTLETASKPERMAATTEKVEGQKRKSEERKAAEEVNKDGSTGEEHRHKTVGGILTAAGTRTKQFLGSALQSGEKKQEKHATLESRKPATPELIKTVSSVPPKDRKLPGATHQKVDTTNIEKAPFHKQIKEDVTKFVHKLNIGNQKQPIDGQPLSMITLAGDNKGAFMHLGSDTAKKEESVPIHRGYKLNSNDIPDSTTDGEVSSRRRKPEDTKAKEEETTKAYINSNAQSINNSIVFNGSLDEHDPGVHLVLYHNVPEPTKSYVKTGPLATHRSEFSATAAEKLTYAPTIRRRCLRGLLLEPSDSDPDNPEKPRRHGCLYNCVEKSKHDDTEIL